MSSVVNYWLQRFFGAMPCRLAEDISAAVRLCTAMRDSVIMHGWDLMSWSVRYSLATRGRSVQFDDKITADEVDCAQVTLQLSHKDLLNQVAMSLQGLEQTLVGRGSVAGAALATSCCAYGERCMPHCCSASNTCEATQHPSYGRSYHAELCSPSSA